MAIPLNPLSDRQPTYKSKVDYLSLRDSIACPAKYTLFLANGCNLACDMCTQPIIRKEKWNYLSLDLLDKILDETAWTYPIYTLFGGEPLLHPKFKEVVHKIKERHCEQEIVTNGYFLEKYIEDIVQADCRLFISMSGVKDVNNAIKHNNNSFDRIKKSISLIRALSESYLSEKVSVNCVLIPDNISSLDTFVSELQTWGIKDVTFQHPQWTDTHIKDLTDREWLKYLKTTFDTTLEMHKSYDLSDSYINSLLFVKENLQNKWDGIRISFFPDFSDTETRMYYKSRECLMLNNDSVCLTPWLNPMITEDGEVKNCIGYSIGNIKDSSFWNIWNGEKNQCFRTELMLHGKYAVCNRCCMMYQKAGEYEK